MWTCHTLPAAEWPALAPFIHAHNRRPDGRVRCLHAEQGDSEADHARELATLAPGLAVFLVAEPAPDLGAPPDRSGAGWAGVIGAEIVTDLGRAWLRGPLLREPDAPGELQDRLIAALLQALPTLRRFDAFPSADETALVQAYRSAGFEDRQRHHVMRRDPPLAAPPPPGITALDAGDPALAGVLPLHDRLFPQTYLPGPALAASLDADHRLFVAHHAGALAGYVYVKCQPLENDGYIDYLGVAESARGLGLGRALLDAAVHWALDRRALPCVHLTVRQDRAPALGLYQAAGFREVAVGHQMTLERSDG